MKKYLRTCNVCGEQDSTFSKSLTCGPCLAAEKKKQLLTKEKQELEELGYTILGGCSYDDHGHRKWKVLTPCCSKEYEPLVLTVRSMLKRRGIVPCSHCGGKERMRKAFDAYIATKARTYDLRDFKDYTKKVRFFSEKSYKQFPDIVNPSSLKRGRTKFHIDHKVPVLWCFENNVPPEIAGSVINLQMMDFAENIRKAAKILYDTSEITGAVNVLDYSSPIFEEGKLNVWKHQLSSPAVNSMLLYRLGRTRKIPARLTTVKEISSKISGDFLEQNHLAGKTGASISYGLFLGDSLLQVLTLGKPRFSKHDLEVLRFATLAGISVQGGASKLFSHAKKNNKGSVVCYSDNQIGHGTVYEHVGFVLDGETGPGYFWEKDGNVLQRYKTQRHKLQKMFGNESSGSESEIMQSNGWRKVLTPGNKRWVQIWE